MQRKIKIVTAATEVDPIVETKTLKNKVVSSKEFVTIFTFLSLSLGAPSGTPLRHRHLQVQQWSLWCQGCARHEPRRALALWPWYHRWSTATTALLIRLLAPVLVPGDICLPDFFRPGSCVGAHNCRKQSTFSGRFSPLRLSYTEVYRKKENICTITARYVKKSCKAQLDISVTMLKILSLHIFWRFCQPFFKK